MLIACEALSDQPHAPADRPADEIDERDIQREVRRGMELLEAERRRPR